ncbi:MAG: UvrD-helicase domain-containing protein [Deltaproteobacteria bacterium]|nr:UvrD-helicase domain-containing protein [Candidatus Zymogenaceae bacterium]
MTHSERILSHLNETQRRVVTMPGGPILILAGAGSGKTRVLTHRIAYLIENGTPSDRILAVTFTNKAAREMKERVLSLVPDRSGGMWLSTFHSFCLRVLRIEANILGVNPDFVIFDDADRRSLLRRCLKELEINEKFLSHQLAGYYIEQAKNKLVTPIAFLDQARDPMTARIGKVYTRYQRELEKSGAMDFSDLIMQTVRLFDEHPEVRAGYQERFLHVLVDEYQDTNTAQYELVRRLAALHGNLCVVGDDDQSIYRWRGADLNNILDFERDFPGAVVVKLEQNYRSTKNILAAANSVVEKNLGRKGKTLYTENDTGEPVVYAEGEDEHAEAAFVVETIDDLISGEEYDPADFAVFYRTNAQSRLFEDALLSARIAYQVVGGVRFYERQEIKDVLAYLRLSASPSDVVSFLRAVNTPPRGVGSKTIERLERIASDADVGLFSACKRALAEKTIAGKAAQGIASFLNAVERVSVAGGPYEAVMTAINESGILDHYRSQGTVEAEGRVDNLREFATAVSEYEEQNPEAGLIDFLDQVALVSDVDEMDERIGRVSLLTIHSAKGLEFPVVFLVGMEEGLFPHSRTLESQDDIEEERRLCYVGMTRAKERLYTTSARRRRVFGSQRFNAVSRFIGEIDPAYLKYESSGTHLWGRDDGETWESTPKSYGGDLVIDRSYAQRDMTVDDYFSDDTGGGGGYIIGGRIRHPEFGIGVIKGIEPQGDRYKLTVLFSGIGIKKVVTGYAPIEILS